MREQKFKTRVTELLNIRHPILCGGMGPKLSDARYVASVVDAGGMGFIVAAGFPDYDDFRSELRKCKLLVGSANFGVNLYVSRQSSGVDRLKEQVRILIDEGVSCVETSGANPDFLVPILKEAGVKVLHKVPAVRYARTAVKIGVDAVIIVGSDSGGHPGKLGISSIVQCAHASDEISIPIIVGGGIGSGKQLAAALAMGADAVMMGSRMLVAEELNIHEDYKKLVVRGDGTESVIVKTAIGDHHRVLLNDSARAVMILDRADDQDFSKYRPHVMGYLATNAYTTGDSKLGMLDYGPATVFADSIKSVDFIFDELLDGAEQAVSRLNALVGV